MKRKNKIKRIYSYLLLVFTSCIISVFLFNDSMAADITLTVNTRIGLQTAINDAGSTPTTIYITDDIIFDGSSVTVPSAASITIMSDTSVNGSPFTLTQRNGRHFTIIGSLTLGDIVLDGSTEGTSATAIGGGVNVSSSSGNFIMNDGVVIQNCLYYSSGAGVITSGTFTMNGGIIRGNRAASAGAGVYVNASGIVTMNGGTITNNTANGSDNAGSGVFVRGVFHMLGGEISHNIATGSSAGGSGVLIFSNGTFYMGSAAGGGDETPIIKNNAAPNMGGGVYVNNGTFHMYSGIISGNTARYGGGIYVTSISKVDIADTGNTPYITNNRASLNGGGIYTADGTYQNLTTSSRTVFNGNTAATLHTPPANAAATYGNIGFSSVSVPGAVNHPLNNYDINYTLGAQISKYTITVQVEGGGTASASETEAYPGMEISLTATPNTGYHFKEWQVLSGDVTISDNRFTMPSANVTVKAIFEEASYALVTFDSNGGSLVPNQTVVLGGKVAKPENPTKLGHVFEGWYVDNYTFANAWDFDNDVVTGDMTLYARWRNEYRDVFMVSFDSNGGSAVQNQMVAYGERVVRPVDPTKEGYDFGGWFTDSDSFMNEWDFESNIVTGDMTLYAKWVQEPEYMEDPEYTEPTVPSPEWGNQPETGDNGGVTLWICLLLASIFMSCVLIGIAYKKRRNEFRN